MPTAAELMTRAVPSAHPDETVQAALEKLRKLRLEEASHLYLVGADATLIGQVAIEKLLTAKPETQLGSLRGESPIEVRDEAEAAAVALLAVERHDADVAVVDRARKLIGAIPIGRLLALLHEKHVDDILRRAGVGAAHPAPREAHETFSAFRARVPWLVLGLIGGMLAGGVAGFFESALRREVTLAFFLPLVVYMADAIGTQTETVLVRQMAYGPVSLLQQLGRESTLGVLMGLALGGAAWLGLWLWNGSGRVAAIVSLTILASAIMATLVASLLPWSLARLGVDPALASGPVATVLQDLLSVAIYLGIATALT
jgi:magnesium transporter